MLPFPDNCEFLLVRPMALLAGDQGERIGKRERMGCCFFFLFFFSPIPPDPTSHGDAKRQMISSEGRYFVPTVDAPIMLAYPAGTSPLSLRTGAVPLVPRATIPSSMTPPPMLFAHPALPPAYQHKLQSLSVLAEAADKLSPELVPPPPLPKGVVQPVRSNHPPRASSGERVCTYIPQPAVRFGGDALPGCYPASPVSGTKFIDVDDDALGYTVRVRRNAGDWMRNAVAWSVERVRRNPGNKECVAELEWRRQALANYETELILLAEKWRDHYKGRDVPSKTSMVVDVALLSRWIFDCYGIETTMGRVVV